MIYAEVREYPIEIINFKKKKMKLLTNKQQKSYENEENCYICKEKFRDKHAKDKNHCEVCGHCYYTSEDRGVAHSIYDLNYGVSKEILIVFRNETNYNYHFIKKELIEEFE